MEEINGHAGHGQFSEAECQVNAIFPGFAKAEESSGADVKAQLLGPSDGFPPIPPALGATNLRIKALRGLQIVAKASQPDLPKGQKSIPGESTKGAAETANSFPGKDLQNFNQAVQIPIVQVGTRSYHTATPGMGQNVSNSFPKFLFREKGIGRNVGPASPALGAEFAVHVAVPRLGIDDAAEVDPIAKVALAEFLCRRHQILQWGVQCEIQRLGPIHGPREGLERGKWQRKKTKNRAKNFPRQKI
jgi:hypothetical protein